MRFHIVDTGTAATGSDVTVTEVDIPAGAASGDFTLTISEGPASPPAGFAAFGQQVVIDAQGATFSPPATVTFTFDASVVGGIAPQDVVILRNLVPVAGCFSAGNPDPCVLDVTVVGDGDMVVRVSTSAFSTWVGAVVDATPPPAGPLCADVNGDGRVTLLKKAALPRVRFHDLRHTSATLLLGRASTEDRVRNARPHAN